MRAATVSLRACSVSRVPGTATELRGKMGSSVMEPPVRSSGVALAAAVRRRRAVRSIGARAALRRARSTPAHGTGGMPRRSNATA